MTPPPFSIDACLGLLDQALKTLTVKPQAQRPNPGTVLAASSDAHLSTEQKAHSIALMRINHVGEICAQALYQGQSLSATCPNKKALLQKAAQEEMDHLAWTEERLQQLGGRSSLLNPLWYAGALGIGVVAGRMGDAYSLGFVFETEKQVEQHLEQHLGLLASEDAASRAVLEQMQQDEMQHGQAALDAGGKPLPWAVRLCMRVGSKVMTGLAKVV